MINTQRKHHYHRIQFLPYWTMSVVLLGSAVYALQPFIQAVFMNAKEGEFTAIATLGGGFSLIGAFLWRIVKKRWQIAPLSGIALFYVLWCIVGNILFVPQTPSLETRWLLGSIVLPLLYIATVGAVTNVKFFVDVLWVSWLILLIVVILLTFTNAQGHFPSFDGVLKTRYRVYLFRHAYGPVTLATLSAALFLLTTSFFMYYPKRGALRQMVLLVALAMALLGLVAAAGRSAWIGSVINLLIIIKLSKRKILFGKRELLLALVIVIGGGLIFRFLWQSNPGLQERITTLPAILTLKTRDKSVSTRVRMWEDAGGLVKKHPLGIGFGAFYNRHGLTTHNEYLNIILGAGYVGFILFFVFWGGNIFVIIRQAISHQMQMHSIVARIVLPLILLAVIVGLTETWSETNVVATVVFWGSLIIGASVSLSGHRVRHHNENMVSGGWAHLRQGEKDYEQ